MAVRSITEWFDTARLLDSSEGGWDTPSDTKVPSQTSIKNYISTASGTDINAVHVNQASEISTVTEKTIYTGNDLAIIEDSASGNIKKRVKLSTILSGSLTPGVTDVSGYASVIPTASFVGNITDNTKVPTVKAVGDYAAKRGANSDITSITGLTTALSITQGGTAQSSYSKGDILYASAANVMNKLPVGENNHVLTLKNGLPSWSVSTGGDTDPTLGEYEILSWGADEEKEFKLSTPATALNSIAVSCREGEINLGVDNNKWAQSDVEDMFDLVDYSTAVSLTLGALLGETTATLASGVWQASDVNRIIHGNGGKAVITSQSGTAVANIKVLSYFESTDIITAGNWKLTSGYFAGSSFTLGGRKLDWNTWDGTLDGLSTVFEAANSSAISMCILDTDKALVCYRDVDNSAYGTACVLSISGTTVTLGSPVVFESANTDFISVCQIDTNKALVCYRDSGNLNYGTACVLSISGTTVTPGSPVVFESASTSSIAACKIDTSKALVCYRDSGNLDYGTTCVLSISGTTVTPGSPVVFESIFTIDVATCQIDTNKALVCYRNVGNLDYGTARVLSISGTTVTPGSSVVFESAFTSYISVCQIDTNKALACYRDADNSGYGTACVLSISGTTVTPGSPVVFESDGTLYTATHKVGTDKALVCYRDSGNSGYGTACVLSISGTTVTPGSPVVFNDTSTEIPVIVYLDSSRVIVSYRDVDNLNYGTSIVLQTEPPSYISNTYVAAVTNSIGTINSSFYTDINSFTPVVTLNGQTTYHGITVDNVTYKIVGDGESTIRNIVKFDTVWKYNSNVTYGSETWTSASVDDVKVAIEEALGVTQNRMSAATAGSVSDETWPTLGTIFGAFMAVHSDSGITAPSVDSTSFNYDAGVTYRTNQLYTNIHPVLGTVLIKSPSGGDPKTVKVRITKQ